MIYRTIEGSALFNGEWYRAHAMGAHERLMDPLWHYLDIGWKKGSNPSVFFDTNYYLLANPDVRDLGLNPLFHYLRYGVGEQRQPTQTGLHALHDLYGPGAPLRLLPVPHARNPRTTLLIDDFTPRDSGSPYARVLAAAAWLAAKHDSRLRVLDRRTSPDYLPLADTIAHTTLKLQRGWEVSRVALSPRYHEIAVQPDEVVIASSFSSDRALLSVPASRRHYIVTDWEPRLFGDSLEGNHASSTATSSDSHFTVLASHPQLTPARGGNAQIQVRAEPSTKNSTATPSTKLTIGVDVDLLASGQMVAQSLATLELAIKKGVIEPDRVEIVLIGSLPRPVNLLASLIPHQVQCQTLADIEAIAPTLDICLSLARAHALGLIEQSVLACGGQVVSRFSDSLHGLHTVSSSDPVVVAEALGAAISGVTPKAQAAVGVSVELDILI